MSDSENPCGRIEKGTRCGPSGAILAFKTAPEEVCHHCKTRHITILRSYGELGLELPTQVESKIERKLEQNSALDRLLISAHQLLANTEAGHAPEDQSSSSKFLKNSKVGRAGLGLPYFSAIAYRGSSAPAQRICERKSVLQCVRVLCREQVTY